MERTLQRTGSPAPSWDRVSPRSRGNILGIPFDLIGYDDVLATIAFWRLRGERRHITLTPPYSVILCHRDRELRRATDSASLTLPDGAGIIVAARLLGYAHRGRVSGPTLMLKLCDGGRAHGFRHFFYGGEPGVADLLAERLSARFLRLAVAGTCCPPFRSLTAEEDAEVVRQINRCRPDIVWVGLGSPKQEKWMARHVGRIEAAALIGVGAAFDFHSGHVRWAPTWVRDAGMEWAYRLLMEPGRMWRRNVNSIVFLAWVLRQRLRGSGGPPRKKWRMAGRSFYRP